MNRIKFFIIALFFTLSIEAFPEDYAARASFIELKDGKQETESKIFFISYCKPVEDASKRPITFIFNGGPCSSSVWLHLGGIGPKRVAIDPSLNAQVAPFSLEDNPDSLLEFTDLVFIDPMGTGFSHCLNPENTKKYLTVRGDMDSIAQFIRNYLNQNGRWLSPKYVLGESYGTTRACGLAFALQDRYGICLNGLILVSQAIDFQMVPYAKDSDPISVALSLPTYFAAAWHHQKLDLGQFTDFKSGYEQCKNFALNRYAKALIYGEGLPEEERAEIAAELCKYTGLPPELIYENSLNVYPLLFRRNLLKEEEMYIGRFDVRYKHPVLYADTEDFFFDPSATAIDGLFTAIFNDYLRKNFILDNPDWTYHVFSEDCYREWSFADKKISGTGYLDLKSDLKQVLYMNPKAKVLFVGGYHDLATPLLAAWYTCNQLHLPKTLKNQIEFRGYSGGHMFYLDRDSLREFKSDLQKWYEK